MRASTLLRILTPRGRALAVAGLLLAVLIGLHGLGFRWDPLGLNERRLKAAEAAASITAADAHARRLEAGEVANQMRRLDEIHQQAVGIAQTTVRATTEARSAHDAEIPLDPDRAARLAGHDRELCRLAPVVCRAAAPDVAPDGDDALRAGAAAGGTDRGGS